MKKKFKIKRKWKWKLWDGFVPEIGLHFYFHFKSFRISDAQRERERVTDPPKTDCTPSPMPPAPQHRCRHLDCTPALAPPSRSSPPKIDPPKTDLIDTDITDLILVLDPMLIDAVDLVVSISSHQWSRHLDLVAHD